MAFDLAQFRLDGRVALVVGASRGIGLGIAQALHGAGATVALAARSAEHLQAAAAELSAAGPEARGFPVDVRDPRDVQALVADVHAAFGRLDILVNCAGLNVRQPADEITQEDWDVVFDVNIRAMFFACQAAARRDARAGRRAHPQHRVGLRPAGGRQRHALRRLQGRRAPADALAGGRVGGGRHPRQRRSRRAACAPHQTEAVFADPVRHAEVVRSIPLGRSSVPDDIAGTVLLLVSDAGEYITGQTLSVDGGWNLGRVGA